MHQPIYFHTTQAIHFKQFQYQNTWTFLVQFKPIETVFNSPKNITVGCPWAAHSTHIGSILWNRIPWPFPTSCTTKHNLLHKSQHKQSKQSIHCHRLSKTAPNISNNSVPSFETDQTATHGLNQLNHQQNT